MSASNCKFGGLNSSLQYMITTTCSALEGEFRTVTRGGTIHLCGYNKEQIFDNIMGTLWVHSGKKHFGPLAQKDEH